MLCFQLTQTKNTLVHIVNKTAEEIKKKNLRRKKTIYTYKMLSCVYWGRERLDAEIKIAIFKQSSVILRGIFFH